MPRPYVLVVDDDPAIRGLVAEALRGEGYLVDMAAHGAEALEAVRAQRPATVLLDLMMPVMDGFTFIEACRRENLNDMPIVVISAAQDARQLVQDLNVEACVTKPFDIDELLRLVGRYASNGHRAASAIPPPQLT